MRLGQKQTEEAKEKNRLWHTGRHHSEETKQKMRMNIPRFNGPHLDVSKKKMSETKKKLFAEGKIKPWNYVDGKAKERNRLSCRKVHQIWCIENNMMKVPFGCVIHHLDLNTTNNNPNNLILLDKKTHSTFHNKLIKMAKNKEVNLFG